jgi:hypothetical protein
MNRFGDEEPSYKESYEQQDRYGGHQQQDQGYGYQPQQV